MEKPPTKALAKCCLHKYSVSRFVKLLIEAGMLPERLRFSSDHIMNQEKTLEHRSTCVCISNNCNYHHRRDLHKLKYVSWLKFPIEDGMLPVKPIAAVLDETRHWD
mmetsp:Transcript_25841/g.63302  ORF Transcript_25841/g.63302 Transcript_25841/m.63302 type:complete len:106 (-) Transcript_25841:1056-1373(-)